MPIFRDSSSTNRTAENGLLGGEGDFVPAFLWRANSQSDFKQGIRRMQCDQKLRIRRERVDFRPKRENRFSALSGWQSSCPLPTPSTLGASCDLPPSSVLPRCIEIALYLVRNRLLFGTGKCDIFADCKHEHAVCCDKCLFQKLF